MKSYEFLKKYHKLQFGIMFDQIIDLGVASIGYCEKDKSPFWNHALTNKVLSIEEIGQIEAKVN